MIKVGVTSCFFYPDINRATFGPKTLCYLENDMANYLNRHDVLAVLIPDLSSEKLNHFLDQMDGIVFQGGADICPESYGEKYLNKDKWQGDKYRDEYELKIMDYAFKNNLPTLGICRGFQLINTYFGGTLTQDIPTELNTETNHRDSVRYDHVSHPIEFCKEGVLNQIYKGQENPIVNSVHHQCVKTLGKDLVEEASSVSDGIVEAFSFKNLKEKFIIGVQWHPEFSHTLGDKVISSEKLYDYFIQEVRSRR